MTIEDPYIAKWYHDKDAAVSLRFDDSCKTHVRYAIPILNRFGIKGTFMINPGRRAYRKEKQFWEEHVPEMGHDLGNHTWNHQGATSLERAEFEIGAVSELIWKLQPNQSKLLVFASGGGGKKWGGRHWRNADNRYKQLLERYHLIDLYDGTHPYISADTTSTAGEMINAVHQAISQRTHQAFTFHRIGLPATTVKGLARYLLKGFDISFPKNDYVHFINSINDLADNIWIASLTDILKYETEYRTAKLIHIKSTSKEHTFDLKIGTDPDLFDHPLTLVIKKIKVDSVVQRNNFDNIHEYRSKGKRTEFINLKPIESRITIHC